MTKRGAAAIRADLITQRNLLRALRDTVEKFHGDYLLLGVETAAAKLGGKKSELADCNRRRKALDRQLRRLNAKANSMERTVKKLMAELDAAVE